MNSPRSPRGFTLVEILVSMVLLSLVLVILVSIVNSTATLWRRTSETIEQFQSATIAFDAMTRRIGQATLNTSWDYQYPGTPPQTNLAPTRYTRRSDLRFISARTETLVGSTSPHRPTYGIFFQAPLGFVDDVEKYGGLDNLLNTWGYYVEFNRDTPPAFITSIPNPPTPRYRYRLMELMQPSNKLSIYSLTAGNPNYAGHEWFADPLNASPEPVHVLAQNVIALVLLPKLSKAEDPTGTRLAPTYSYDSAPSAAAPTDPALNPVNQLPPLVQVTLVAIDEPSAVRLAQGSNVPGFDEELQTLFAEANQYDADLAQLQTTLSQRRINYRIFVSNVALRGAKWSKY